MTARRPGLDDPADKLAAALDQLARARRVHRQGIATERGLSPLQLDILQTLLTGTLPDASVVPLARELGVSQPTVSDAVGTLDRKGLLVRTPGARGRARTTLTVTDAGAAAAAFEDPVATIARNLPAHLRGDLLSATLGIIAGLVDLGVITVARNCLTCTFHRDDPTGHRCTLLGVDLPPADLRVTCPEHEPAA